MKAALGLLLFVLGGLGNFAHADPIENANWYDGPASSCKSLQRAVAREGMIFILTGEETFIRPVRDVSFCMPQQTLKPMSTKSKDNPRCSVGFACKEWY